MTTSPVGIERRVGQRFPYLLPLSLRQPSTSVEGVGFTQDLSSRGVFFFTNAVLIEGSEIELTLRMPSEITLGESMPVRCRGRILRVVRPTPSLRTHRKMRPRSALRFGSRGTSICPSRTLPPPSLGCPRCTSIPKKSAPWFSLLPVQSLDRTQLPDSSVAASFAAVRAGTSFQLSHLWLTMSCNDRGEQPRAFLRCAITPRTNHQAVALLNLCTNCAPAQSCVT